MANNQPSEQEIQFRKRARRRLVGAIALVLLMVTVLPMVLDDQQTPEAPLPEVAISIPSQDGDDFTSRVVPVEPEAAPAMPADAESPAAAADEPAPEQPAQPVAAPVQEQPAKPQSSTSQPTAGKFAVQFGVFSSAANAAKLQRELSGKGVESYTADVKSGTGVRMGHYATRAEAEQALEPLKALGIKGIVVAN
jgi:DedD protein